MTDPTEPHAVPGRTAWGARLDAGLARRGVVSVPARDRLLAVVVAVLTVLALLPLLGFGADELGVGPGVVLGVLVLALVAAQSLLLAVRRTRPVACLLAVAALQVVLVALVPPDVALRGPAPLVAAYTVATVLPGRDLARALGAAVGLEVVGALVAGAVRGEIVAAAGAVLSGVVLYAAAALVGVNVATRRRYVEVVRARAAEVVAAQEARVREAVSGERTRMARELHDIAAHHLSAMVVQAAAVQRLVDRDPDAARDGVAAIRAQGRRTLDDLRTLVGVLRDPDRAEDGAPVPGLAEVADLVEAARALGTDVDLEQTGPRPELGPLADVTAYRLVQEALSNARQHAPGAPVRVSVDASGATVAVAVLNGPSPGPRPGSPRPGVGLVGMRERAQLVGATLDVGPTDDGGWRVHAVLPAADDQERRDHEEALR